MRNLDFGALTRWWEIIFFLASISVVRTIPSEIRWENLVAALAWVGIVAWSARLMRRGDGLSFFGCSGALEAASDVLERLVLLRDWAWGIIVVLALEMTSAILAIAGLWLMCRDRARG